MRTNAGSVFGDASSAFGAHCTDAGSACCCCDDARIVLRRPACLGPEEAVEHEEGLPLEFVHVIELLRYVVNEPLVSG